MYVGASNCLNMDDQIDRVYGYLVNSTTGQRKL